MDHRKNLIPIAANPEAFQVVTFQELPSTSRANFCASAICAGCHLACQKVSVGTREAAVAALAILINPLRIIFLGPESTRRVYLSNKCRARRAGRSIRK